MCDAGYLLFSPEVRMTVRSLATLLLTSLPLAGMACDSTSTGGQPVTISFSTKAQPAAFVAQDGNTSLDISVGEGGNTLVITKAELVLRELELKLSTTSSCATGTVEDSCESIELGPMKITLPVTDVVASPISTTVPAGTYHEIEFDIRRPGTDPADQAFVAANPQFNNVSIRVEGTFNGTPFVFTSQLDQEVQIDFNPPVVIAEGANNVTIAVDLRSWFRNSQGVLINPATANPGQPNESAVTSRIQASLRAFEDDDKSGS
jgi:hypothetical protein